MFAALTLKSIDLVPKVYTTPVWAKVIYILGMSLSSEHTTNFSHTLKHSHTGYQNLRENSLQIYEVILDILHAK